MFSVVRNFEDGRHAAEYTAHRPKYPTEVFNQVIDYMRKDKTTENPSKKFSLAVDVGCGPGLMSTSFLAKYFDQVLGVDVSEAQIQQANTHKEFKNINFKVAQGESLPVQDESVDLIQLGATLHWVDHRQFYRECDRVLVPGGVIAAFCCHSAIKVINHVNADALNDIIEEIIGRIYSEDNPAFNGYTKMVMKRYTDPKLQIPYDERERVDGIYFNVNTTIAGFQQYYFTISLVRKYLMADEVARNWWKSCMCRLLEAYGTDSMDAPLSYRLEVFMLLGRKPRAQEASK